MVLPALISNIENLFISDLKWKLGKALTPKAVFENNEVKILGNFGSVVFSHK